MNYELEKDIWTEQDFETMGWHDCKIHAFTFFPEKYEFVLDIDYIFKWVKPDETGYYKFWISPATMVFENAYDIVFDLVVNYGIEISGISRENPEKPKNSEFCGKETEWSWEIDSPSGAITLKSVGYKMYVRSSPILKREQSIEYEERGGISFSREKISA
jgi:hypothetical protein